MSAPIKLEKKKPQTTWRLVRNRIVAGLFVVLPLFITFVVIQWLYETLSAWIISPISQFLIASWWPDQQVPFYVENIIAPLSALFLVGSLLFVAGIFFNSRLHRIIDWGLHNVPGVNLVYSVVSNVFSAVQRSKFGADEFKRVVLVQFPHPGMKVPAFVTSETSDVSSGEKILCVYVPTTPVPTSGYMLLVPESEVVALDWDLQETLQAIVSGGITAPTEVKYYADHQAPKIDNQD